MNNDPDFLPDPLPAPENPVNEDDVFGMTADQVMQYREEHQQKKNRQRLHMLIVEDEPFLRKLLYQTLVGSHSLETAASAEEGWKRYLEKDPDIVFLDIQLLNLDGHTLARRIKKLDPEAYIIMVTASRDIADIEKAKENGVDGFIVKPYNKLKLDECINQYIQKHKPYMMKWLTGMRA